MPKILRTKHWKTVLVAVIAAPLLLAGVALHAWLNPNSKAVSSNQSLRKLAEYEDIYGGKVTSQLMVFASLPYNGDDAANQAEYMATKLKEYSRVGITPLVIMEPTVNNKPINLQDFANGKYDATLTAYFKSLKKFGITDAAMGTWVHFPENNLPEWGNIDARLFQKNIVRAARLQKSVYPGSRVSVLLNSQTFNEDNYEQGSGSYASLLPYVRGLPKGLFDSFGLQGFPWVSPASARDGVDLLNPAQYLNADLAQEAARELGTKNIWFNTGTFGRAYINNPEDLVTFTTAQRQKLLDGVLEQAKKAQRGGYNVAVNLFAFNGEDTSEAIDWSYWHDDGGDQTDQDRSGKELFKRFAGQLNSANIDLWLFDAKD